jgi:hypothetical protein
MQEQDRHGISAPGLVDADRGAACRDNPPHATMMALAGGFASATQAP